MSARTRRSPAHADRAPIEAFGGAEANGTTVRAVSDVAPVSARLDGIAARLGVLESGLRSVVRRIARVEGLLGARTLHGRFTVRPASVVLTGDVEGVARDVVDAVGPAEARRIAEAIVATAEAIGGGAA